MEYLHLCDFPHEGTAKCHTGGQIETQEKAMVLLVTHRRTSRAVAG